MKAKNTNIFAQFKNIVIFAKDMKTHTVLGRFSKMELKKAQIDVLREINQNGGGIKKSQNDYLEIYWFLVGKDYLEKYKLIGGGFEFFLTIKGEDYIKKYYNGKGCH